MRVLFLAGLVAACLFLFSEPSRGQVFDNQCPSTQSSMVPMRTVNLANGHFNDTVCADSNGNLIFQALNASLTASDTFTRANATTLGPNWSTPPGAGVFGITTNAAKNISGTGVSFWNDPRFVSTAQFSQVTISIQGADNVGPAVMISSGAGNEYSCFQGTGATTLILSRRLGAGGTTLASGATTGTSGDILRLEIDSSGNLTCYKNGVSTLTATDTTYKNGSPGIFDVGTASSITNWSGGNLPVSLGSTMTVGPPNTCKMLENIVCVDQANTQKWPGGDYGAWVMAAIASLPTVNSYKTGQVMLAPSTAVVTQSTPVVIVSPFLSIIGPGAGALQISCTFNGNCWDVHTNPFTINPGFIMRGFSVTGQGAGNANAVAFHIGDIVGGKFEDLGADNFLGANSACFWFDNINGFTERNWFNALHGGLSQATQLGCTKEYRWTNTTNTAGTSSFAHNHYIANKYSVGTNQTALSVEGGNHNATDWYFTGNSFQGTTSTVFAISGVTFSAGSPTFIEATNLNISGECTSPCTAGTLVNIGATNNVLIHSGGGFYDLSAVLTNTISGNLIRYLNDVLNLSAAPETLRLASSNGAGAAGVYNINVQASGLTRTIAWNDPGVSSTAITFSGFAVPVMNGAGTAQGNWHVVQDTATLAAGTVTVTLTGNAVFTNATSYTCVADDDTAIGATRVLQNSGSSITITGTGTDVIRYICIGN